MKLLHMTLLIHLYPTHYNLYFSMQYLHTIIYNVYTIVHPIVSLCPFQNKVHPNRLVRLDDLAHHTYHMSYSILPIHPVSVEGALHYNICSHTFVVYN